MRTRRSRRSLDPRQQTLQKLQKGIKQLRFDGIPLSEALDFFRQVSGVNMYVHWSVLEGAGLEKTSTVNNIKLNNVTVRKALEFVLEDVGGGKALLGYDIDGDIVVISTQSHLIERRKMPIFAPTREQRAQEMGVMLDIIQQMQQTSFDPASAGMIALGALKDEVSRPDNEIIADLEAQLARTETIGLRNAIRLMLKDLYKRNRQNDKVLEHMRAMLAENDAAISGSRRSGRGIPARRGQ